MLCIILGIMGHSADNIKRIAINQFSKNENQRKVWFLNETLPDGLQRLYVEQYRLIQTLCGRTGVTDVTDVTDITDVTDVTGCYGHYGTLRTLRTLQELWTLRT